MTKGITQSYILQRINKNKENDCWEWTGGTQSRGYGITGIPKTRKKIVTHRASYEAFIGEIPKGLYVCHKCDNPPCCNPNHLFVGTQKENLQDMVRKGRCNPHMLQKTHCPLGHPYNEENTYRHNNRRHCKLCKRISFKKWYKKKRNKK